MDRETIEQIKRDEEDNLMGRPGVTGVTTGKKRVGGKVTDEWAIIVYVKNKGAYAPGDEIPPSIRGAPTDVVEKQFELH